MKNKSQKLPKQRKDFSQKFADKLREMNLGIVEEDRASDNSSRWVSLRIDDSELHFEFDLKGEKMYRLGLYRDIVQVVDQNKIFGN